MIGNSCVPAPGQRLSAALTSTPASLRQQTAVKSYPEIASLPAPPSSSLHSDVSEPFTSFASTSASTPAASESDVYSSQPRLEGFADSDSTLSDLSDLSSLDDSDDNDDDGSGDVNCETLYCVCRRAEMAPVRFLAL